MCFLGFDFRLVGVGVVTLPGLCFVLHFTVDLVILFVKVNFFIFFGTSFFFFPIENLILGVNFQNVILSLN